MTRPKATPPRIALFFCVAFLVTWSTQLPAALATKRLLAGPVERFTPLIGLGLFGPMLAALLLSRRESGGIHGLFAQFKRWRVGAGWYVLALAMPAVLLTAGLAAHALVTGRAPDTWAWPPREPERIVAALLIPCTEEIGWRGYALPRLQAHVHRIAAGVILGILWGAWHIPMFVIQGVALEWVPAVVLYFVAGSVVFSWLYNRTGGSLPIAVVAHVGAHLDNSNRTMPGDVVPFLSQGLAYAALAIALIVLDRKAWQSQAPGVAPT